MSPENQSMVGKCITYPNSPFLGDEFVQCRARQNPWFVQDDGKIFALDFTGIIKLPILKRSNNANLWEFAVISPENNDIVWVGVI